MRRPPRRPTRAPRAREVDYPYTLEFYGQTDTDAGPVLRWLRDELTPTQRRALGMALREHLQRFGLGVCEGVFGRQLGGGLFEFRLDQDPDELLRRLGAEQGGEAHGKQKLLLRVFCHAHGNKIVLLLGGYDKLKRPSKRHQQDEISIARARLADWRRSRR